LSSQIDGILNQTARNLHIMAYRNGSGYRGVVGVGTGTAVLTLTNPEDAHNFEVGMSIDGATGAGAPHGTPDTISAINRIAGTLTSTLAVWPAAILNGDNLFVEGDYTIAAGINMVSGLEAWLPAVVPAPAFFGVVRTLDATRLGGLRFAGAALVIEEALNNAANLVAAHGGTPTHCFLNYTNYQDLINALGAKATYEQIESAHTGMDGARIGFEGVRIIGPKGPIKVIPDNACPVNLGYMLQLDTWVCASIGAAPKILNQDGNRYLRVNNADQVEVRVGYYGNIGCKAPGYNCRITL
jgi:energy-converting hydrogenase Eha subunit B